MTVKKRNYMTVDQVAEELQFNSQVVRRYLREGRIPGRKIGREWRVSRQELEEFIRRREGKKSLA